MYQSEGYCQIGANFQEWGSLNFAILGLGNLDLFESQVVGKVCQKNHDSPAGDESQCDLANSFCGMRNFP